MQPSVTIPQIYFQQTKKLVVGLMVIEKKVMLAVKVIVASSLHLKTLLWKNIFKDRIFNLDFY